MTKQIERAYRSNRRRSWLLIAAVVAVAGVVIPIASGAADKNYTLLFPTSGATSPAAKTTTSSPTENNQTLCAETAYTTVTLILKNTAKTVSLGSADITFPASVTLVGTPTLVSDSSGYTLPAAANATRASNKVSLRELSMPKGRQLRLTVSLTASATARAALNVSAAVKQSNDFNDNTGGANTFDNPTMPTITVETCAATIKGQIWNDSNESGAPKDSFEGLQRPTSQTPNDFSVVLFENGVKVATQAGAGAGVRLNYDDAGYTFSNVPTGRNYVVCEVAGTVVLGKGWKQTTGSPQAACDPALPNGWSVALSGDVTDQDFGNVSTVMIDCSETGEAAKKKIGTSDTSTRYTVKVVGSSGTQAQFCAKNGAFVLEAYAPTLTQRVANFHPADPGTTTIDLYVIEQLEWNFDGTAQPGEVAPAVRSLKYDDDPDALPGLQPMPYCLKDPRADANGDVVDQWSLVSTTAVLPPSATSCLMASTERAVGAEPFRREDWIFSSVDGFRLGP